MGVSCGNLEWDIKNKVKEAEEETCYYGGLWSMKRDVEDLDGSKTIYMRQIA